MPYSASSVVLPCVTKRAYTQPDGEVRDTNMHGDSRCTVCVREAFFLSSSSFTKIKGFLDIFPLCGGSSKGTLSSHLLLSLFHVLGKPEDEEEQQQQRFLCVQQETFGMRSCGEDDHKKRIIIAVG